MNGLFWKGRCLIWMENNQSVETTFLGADSFTIPEVLVRSPSIETNKGGFLRRITLVQTLRET